MIKKCKYCGKVIIENWDKWLEENPNVVYLQCPYCYNLEELK